MYAKMLNIEKVYMEEYPIYKIIEIIQILSSISLTNYKSLWLLNLEDISIWIKYFLVKPTYVYWVLNTHKSEKKPQQELNFKGDSNISSASKYKI